MANVPIRDGNAIAKFLKASGLGSDASPYVPEHTETNSAAILAKLVAGLDVTNHPAGGATEAKQDAAIAHLASLVTGIAADPATGARQDAAIAHLASLVTGVTVGNLPADPATATLQNAVIAHLATLVTGVTVSNFPTAPADPSTGARQDTAIGHLVSLVAGIPADPATGALQSAAIAHLASLVAAIGAPVDVASIAVPGAIYHGQTVVATPGTEVALAATQALLSGVTVKALAANTGLIFVGANPVTSSTGFELAAGEQIFLEVGNLATVFLDAAVAGEGVSWVSA